MGTLTTETWVQAETVWNHNIKTAADIILILNTDKLPFGLL